jgi:asparagine synthase (glutamine-hydrolysing)
MANFIAVLDADTERRNRFIRSVTTRLAFLDGLRTDTLACGPFAVAWAVTDRSPVSTAHREGCAAVLFGDAIEGPAPHRLDANGLIDAWRAASKPGSGSGDASSPPVFDGLYAAVRYDASRGLLVAGDVLGLFPIFHATNAGVTLAGSSPELFGQHPLFPAAPSYDGIVMTLLAHASVGGRTLLGGVRRLGVGHALLANGRESAVEVKQYVIPRSPAYRSLDFEDHLRILDDAWSAVIRRHVTPGSAVGLLLSGGRDSRLLAGYLDRSGADVHALTLGRVTDYDAACASRVAKRLGFRHDIVDLAATSLADCAATQAGWEHLASGFSNVHTWGAVPAMRTLPVRCVSGYLREIREIPLGEPSFEGWFGGPHAHGIAPDLLRRLLRPEWKELVDQLYGELRREWESAADEPAERQWRFLLAHGARAHPGGVQWRFTFGSWPIVPLLDRDLLETIASIPSSSFADRRAQDALLRTRFAPLARLPLDRNSHDTRPIAPTFARAAINPLLVATRRLRSRVAGRESERRYYHRVFDIDNEAWRGVRRRAEAGREALTALFDPAELASVLPRPDADFALDHPIRDGFSRKLLLGLMLWAGDHPV